MNESNEQDTMERHSVLAEAAYIPTIEDKMQHVEEFYPGQYEILEQHTNKEHSTFRHTPSNKIIYSIRGTDISDQQGGRLGDLGEDTLLVMGLGNLSPRLKKADKKLQELIQEHGKENISITGHSLGGHMAKALSIKHGVESHAFNPGSSSLSVRNTIIQSLDPKARRRAKQNNVYYTTPSASRGFDILSISGLADPLQNTKVVKQKNLTKEEGGVLSPHSIAHFHPERMTVVEEGNVMLEIQGWD